VSWSITEQKTAIKQLFTTLDCNNTNIKKCIELALKDAIKNTKHIQIAAHNDIYLYITNASIQLIYTEMQNNEPANQQAAIEEQSKKQSKKPQPNTTSQHLTTSNNTANLEEQHSWTSAPKTSQTPTKNRTHDKFIYQ
jgi:hypothetical protein